MEIKKRKKARERSFGPSVDVITLVGKYKVVDRVVKICERRPTISNGHGRVCVTLTTFTFNVCVPLAPGVYEG